MSDVFEVTDKSGRKIRLTKERWSHITTKHPDIAGKEDDIKGLLEKPDLILHHEFNDNMRNYYKYDKQEKAYLLVSVKYLNGKGFVATAFYTTKIRKK